MRLLCEMKDVVQVDDDDDGLGGRDGEDIDEW